LPSLILTNHISNRIYDDRRTCLAYLCRSTKSFRRVINQMAISKFDTHLHISHLSQKNQQQHILNQFSTTPSSSIVSTTIILYISHVLAMYFQDCSFSWSFFQYVINATFYTNRDHPRGQSTLNNSAFIHLCFKLLHCFSFKLKVHC